jgi:hypothetical protein
MIIIMMLATRIAPSMMMLAIIADDDHRQRDRVDRVSAPLTIGALAQLTPRCLYPSRLLLKPR